MAPNLLFLFPVLPPTLHPSPRAEQGRHRRRPLWPHLGPTLASTPSEISHSKKKRQERIYDPLRRVFLILLERMVDPFPLGLRKKQRWDTTPGDRGTGCHGSRSQEGCSAACTHARTSPCPFPAPSRAAGPGGSGAMLLPQLDPAPCWLPSVGEGFQLEHPGKERLCLHLHHLIFSYVM